MPKARYPADRRVCSTKARASGSTRAKAATQPQEAQAMLVLIAVIGVVVLAHVAPFPFLLDVTDDTVWRMPRTATPTIYLTFDDGPNPEATPQLLDVLARHGVRATFFVIDKHLTHETAPIVRRTFEEGHAVGVHWHSRELMFRRP